MNRTIFYYDKYAKDLVKRYESANVDKIQQLLLEVFPNNSNLLEIGCGSGRDANFMFENNYKITAIDASKEMILEAKKIHPLLKNFLYVMTIPDELSFKNNSFDGVYSIATLMHLEEKEIVKSIKKIYDILKDKGIFLFSVSLERDDINKKFKDSKGRHFTTISKNKWLQLCNHIGFKTLKTVITDDGLDRSGIVWLTCIMEK
jgi:SAM-dependent methyltransferase